MRLRSWLLVTYLLVMLLPLAMAYVLFAWINSINSEQKVEEFFGAYLEMRQIQEALDIPTLYRSEAGLNYSAHLISSDLELEQLQAILEEMALVE